MARSAVVKKPRIRECEGIPGTVEPGFQDHPIVEERMPQAVLDHWCSHGIDPAEVGLKRYSMGPCNILVGREPAGANEELLWHLTISTPSRHPTWDEIKAARYRLLPAELTFGMLLPPSEFYVNVPEQDHVMQLWEITDPREPWTTG